MSRVDVNCRVSLQSLAPQLSCIYLCRFILRLRWSCQVRIWWGQNGQRFIFLWVAHKSGCHSNWWWDWHGMWHASRLTCLLSHKTPWSNSTSATQVLCANIFNYIHLSFLKRLHVKGHWSHNRLECIGHWPHIIGQKTYNFAILFYDCTACVDRDKHALIEVIHTFA